MNFDTYRELVASDISSRDGVGLEVYKNEKLIIEIFRDDSQKTRSVTLFNQSVTFEEMENAMTSFKTSDLWNFQEGTP
ncbi:MAG: hypothetical protein AAGC74_12020 [Verrucomicrobiota bacterium]